MYIKNIKVSENKVMVKLKGHDISQMIEGEAQKSKMK